MTTHDTDPTTRKPERRSLHSRVRASRAARAVAALIVAGAITTSALSGVGPASASDLDLKQTCCVVEDDGVVAGPATPGTAASVDARARSPPARDTER
jgi:hypothetical protein